MFFGRNDAEAETPVLWPPHAKSWLTGKDSAAGRDWGQEEKGTTEDEMAGWHHWLDGREAQWTPGVGDGQGGLACCDSWDRKELDTTEWLNWTECPQNDKTIVMKKRLMITRGQKQGEDWDYKGSSFVMMEQLHILIIVAVTESFVVVRLLSCSWRALLMTITWSLMHNDPERGKNC